MIHYELSFLIAVFAFVWAYVLTRPNAALNGLYNKLYTYFKTDERANEGKPYHPLFMVLIHCEKCIAGQMALWLFLYLFAAPCYATSGLFITFLKLVFFVSFTILTAGVVKGIYTRYIEHT